MIDDYISEDLIETEFLEHYGVKRKSGRYPWGSGVNPYQHEAWFDAINKFKAEGLTEKEIAEKWGISTGDFRRLNSIAGDEKRRALVAQVKSLSEDGYSNVEIGAKLGLNESTVRSLKNSNAESRMNAAKQTAEFLTKQVDEKGMIDVGKGVEKELGVSREKLDEALLIMQIQGYEVYGRGVSQITNPGKQTTLEVVAKPGTPYSDLYDLNNVKTITEYKSYDNGETYWTMEQPRRLDSNRVMVRFKDDVDPHGVKGEDKDGLIEIRPGVKDLSLGDGTHYAQVRILCDGEKYGLEGDRYMKGMAAYGDPKDFPKGVDVIFNQSKTPDKVSNVLKEAEPDPMNPFAATIVAQNHYKDENGETQLGYINKKNDEGDWSNWSKTLPSQFLSKQRTELIERQLNLTIANKDAELEEIKSLTNPTIKRKLLETYASSCDSQAVDLDAAALPRQRYQVILPVNSLKERECFAPNYRDGEQLALIRFPHGGTFEIPIVTVNNKNKEARELISPNAVDAIGLNKKAANILSGADFDGDTVMVIPLSSKVRVKTQKPLEGLKDFDPHVEYAEVPGVTKILEKKNVGKEMGMITNLITDMSIQGATSDELARAVRHSMVIIDANKHRLDYKRSEAENGIKELKDKYQGHYNEVTKKMNYGAATLISRASSQASIPKTKGSPRIDEEGNLVYKIDTEPSYKTGKQKMQETTKMAATKDAYTLVSNANNKVEVLYADFANTLKQRARDARLEIAKNEKLKYSPEAKAKYEKEVKSLEAKLQLAESNRPRERKAQIVANTMLNEKILDNPILKEDKAKKSKEAQRCLKLAREQVGAKRHPIEITKNEWDAIQEGAISDTKLWQILNFADIDIVRQYATPKAVNEMGASQIAKIKAMKASGYTNAEIADSMGVSSSTVSKYLKE